MRRLPLLLLALLPLLLSFGGCAGGALPEGGPVPALLIYETDWTKRMQPGGGLSQRVTLYNRENVPIRSLIAEQSSEGIQQYTLDNIPAGVHRLFVELFSQRGAAGTRTGVIETWIDLRSPQTFRSAVGEQVSQVRVTPEAATFAVPESHQFYAAGYTVDGRATFTTVGSFQWEVFGGVGTVDQEGLVLASQPGTGSVRATHTASGVQGSAVLNVQPTETRTSKWTVMVFLNAANDLHPFSTLNMNQMERVAQNPEVRFVVQWKLWKGLYPQSPFDGTRRYLVQPDETSTIASRVVQDLGTGVDMGKPETLREFIEWTKTYYPAERYALVVWNHGNGWRRSPGEMNRAVSYDDQTGNAIQVWQLQQALGNNQLDILAWDASLMQMLEVAYEVKDRAQYVVGSEESPPGEGYPYDLVFSRFRDNPDASTRDLTKAFVDGMLENPIYTHRKITQSSVETAKLEPLAQAVDALAGQLLGATGISQEIQTVRNTAQAYSQATQPPRYYRDLYDVAQKLEALVDHTGIKAAAAEVRARLTDAVAWNGRNANSPGSYGLSIDFTPGHVFMPSATDYGRLRFAQATRWDEWLAVSP
jgi:hypothetical protein